LEGKISRLNHSREKLTNRPPGYVRAARLLFFADAAVWLAFAIAALSRQAGSQPVEPATNYWVPSIMLANAAALLVAGIGLGQQKRLFFYFALLVLALNLGLALTEQFGAYDFIPLLIAGFLSGLLLATRAHYFRR
jgi:hypothetical protein